MTFLNVAKDGSSFANPNLMLLGKVYFIGREFMRDRKK